MKINMEIFKKYFLTYKDSSECNVGRIILIEDNQIATRHDNPYHLTAVMFLGQLLSKG